MAFTIRPVEYYYVNVRDELGAAYRVLSQLAERGVNLLAFTAVPTGPALAQFSVFPEDPGKFVAEARSAGLPLDGPHRALLAQGDDELGAFASVHERLVAAGVDLYASSGVTDARGDFGYVIYVRGPIREGRDGARSLTVGGSTQPRSAVPPMAGAARSRTLS